MPRLPNNHSTGAPEGRICNRPLAGITYSGFTHIIVGYRASAFVSRTSIMTSKWQGSRTNEILDAPCSNLHITTRRCGLRAVMHAV